MDSKNMHKINEDEDIYVERAHDPQADAKTLRMGTESVPKLLLEFAIPSIIGMLVNSAYNIISAAFLGQAVGESGLAVTTAAFPPGILFMALAMLVGNGGNALAALRLGQGRKGKKMVEYALAGMDNNLFVSTYMLQLPDKKTLEEFLLKQLEEGR